MRLLRYVGAATAILLSAWLLLGYEGLRTTVQDRAQGWEIYELPPHPILRMVASLTFGLALPFLSAWLMPPTQTREVIKKTLPVLLWRSYSFRLAFSYACALLAALMLVFLTMALLDAGVI